jgi:hypothetical protein
MNLLGPRSGIPRQALRGVIAIVCVASLPWSSPLVSAQEAPQAQSQEMTTTEEAPKIPNDRLDSLVAPIALYADPLLAQTLAASTYPLEIIQLQQWMEKNKNLKDKALADAVAKEPWDASVQAMAAFPDVVQRLAGNVQWTTDLGNAFLAQQADVMDAIQRMRAKAQGTGNLKTSAQQKVETQTVEGGKQVIVVEQADPDTVYVPSYDPAVVYGEPAYPYPSYSYPGYLPGMALSLGTGLALGAAWGGGWGYNCGWDDDDININDNNKYVNNYNKNVNKNVNQNNKWGHNPEHRGGTPYANKQTANKYGGTARGEARQPTAGAGTRPAGGGAGKPGGPGGAGGVGGAGKPGGPGGAGGVGGAGKPGGPGGAGGAGSAGKPGGPGGAGKATGGGTGKAGTGSAGKATGGGAHKASGGGGKGGADKVGGHKPSAGGGGGAFAGGSGGSAKAASNRGGSSMKGGGGKGGGSGGRGGGGGKKGGGGGRKR